MRSNAPSRPADRRRFDPSAQRPIARLRRIEPVLRRAFRDPCRLPRGSRLLVAASGGADSTALLVGLVRIAHEFDFSLHAAHLHHGLRGAEADGDLAATRALCARLGVGLIAGRCDAKSRMRRHGLSGHDGLRTIRRRFLLRAARRAGAVAIATAHTADDQLETLLMRLGRGTGLAGLGGIPARRGRWLRPLLEATRADVEHDLRRAGVAWRDDRSNDDPAYLRSRIRQLAVPALVRAFAGGKGRDVTAGPVDRASAGTARLGRHASRAAAEIAAATRLLEARAERELSRVCRIQIGEFALDSQGVATYPFALRRALYRRLWRRMTLGPVGLTHHHLAALDRLMRPSRSKARLELPGGVRVERTGRIARWKAAGLSSAEERSR